MKQQKSVKVDWTTISRSRRTVLWTGNHNGKTDTSETLSEPIANFDVIEIHWRLQNWGALSGQVTAIPSSNTAEVPISIAYRSTQSTRQAIEIRGICMSLAARSFRTYTSRAFLARLLLNTSQAGKWEINNGWFGASDYSCINIDKVVGVKYATS